jgi:hypothetical protein
VNGCPKYNKHPARSEGGTMTTAAKMTHKAFQAQVESLARSCGGENAT